MSTRLATIVLCLVPMAACASTHDLELVRALEVRAEVALAEALALPDDTPGKAERVAEATARERELEQERKALEAFQPDELIGTGIEVATKGARGDFIGAGKALGGLAAAGVLVLLGRRRKKRKLEAAQ